MIGIPDHIEHACRAHGEAGGAGAHPRVGREQPDKSGLWSAFLPDVNADEAHARIAS
jgi:hypothetical protein